MKITKLSAVLLAGCLLCASCGKAEEPEAAPHTPLAYTGGEAAFEPAAENGELKLYVRRDTGAFYVENAARQARWYSNPPDAENDPVANSLYKINMRSQLHLTFLNDKLVTDDVNNYTGSVQQKTFACESIPNGVRFTFDFPDEGFTIPVEYVLGDGRLTARVAVGEIEEHGDNRLVSVELLPYFGAAASASSGFVLLPDGCGGLIDVGSPGGDVLRAGSYSGQVYGRDPVYSLPSRALARSPELTLPLFAIRENSQAFLAIIRKGAALASVSASPNLVDTSYASASSAVTLRGVDNAVLREMTGSARSVVTYNPYMAALDAYEVDYFLLTGEDAQLETMAELTGRELLGEKAGGAPDSRLFLELQMTARELSSILAVPVETVRPLMTAGRVETLLGELGEAGLSGLSVQLDGWQKGSDYQKVPVFGKADGAVGGRRAFAELLAAGKRTGAAIYPAADFINLYKAGNGAGKSADAVRNISGGVYEQSTYLRSTYTKNPAIPTWNLLGAAAFERLFTAFAGQAAGQAVGIADRSSGAILPSDGRRSQFTGARPTDRQTALERYESAYRAAGDKGLRLLFNDPKGYVFPYAAGLTGLENSTSGYAGFSREVPFVQMVLHGRVSYAGGAWNLSGDFRRTLLKAAEYGEAPYFRLTEFADGDTRLAARFSDVFSSNLAYWQPKLVEAYRELEPLLARVEGARMTGHGALAPGLYRTVYDNGVRVYVNYGDVPAQADGLEIPARSFRLAG